VKAGGRAEGGNYVNHNQTVARGLKVQSHLRAGADPPNPSDPSLRSLSTNCNTALMVIEPPASL